jgi:6-phosphogluconate dehydrogenase (decarboxylating)
MIHNGIEYGLMLAYAEGFDPLGGAASESLPAEHRHCFNLPEIAEAGGAAALLVRGFSISRPLHYQRIRI